MVSALLSDLGVFVLQQMFPAEYGPVVAQPPDVLAYRQCELEEEHFGLNHADVSVAPDPQNTGWVIVSARGEKSIVGGSGRYRGRTGSVRVHGTNDLRRFPDQMTQDDFWLIQLDPH